MNANLMFLYFQICFRSAGPDVNQIVLDRLSGLMPSSHMMITMFCCFEVIANHICVKLRSRFAIIIFRLDCPNFYPVGLGCFADKTYQNWSSSLVSWNL